MLLQKNIVKKYLALLPDEQTQEAWKWVREPSLDPSCYNLEPHYLTHPGEVIKDELEARGISQRQLARSIGVPASQLNELLNAKRSLSAEMALLIGQALGLDPAPLLALQTDYNLLSAKRNKSFLERLKDIPRIAAVF
jgi:addiction module HigA family antidote